MRYQNHLTLPNDVQEVPQLNAFVDEVCETAGLDMSTTMKINLAIEEAVVNVMNYAYPNGKGDVDIDAQINDEHPMAYLRVNCTLQQFDEFLDFYDIKEGDAMYLAPEDRVIVW